MNPVGTMTTKELQILANGSLVSEIALTSEEKRVRTFFEETSSSEVDWEDWRWQLRNRIKTKALLSKLIHLTPEEEAGIDKAGGKLTMAITPSFASLMDPENPRCPIRKQCVPTIHEFTTSPEEMVDPCGEEKHSPVHGLVHRYPDRVLFLVSEMCAMYCRYCTRSRMVGDGNRTLSTATYEAAFDYIRSNKKVRDVLISGGDPLMLADSLLEYILKNIKAIPHVEFVRIGTRVPATLPQRITPALVAMLKRYGPIWMSLHFSHYKEITPRVKAACGMLADAGIPLGSQTVLLKGINDTPAVMKKLMHELLKIRVRPYYIYQCDPIIGSKHFRTSVAAGIKVMQKLRGFTTGYAVPTYVIDAPGGGGKVPISPNYIVSYQDGKCTIKNYDGNEYVYCDPA